MYSRLRFAAPQSVINISISSPNFLIVLMSVWEPWTRRDSLKDDLLGNQADAAHHWQVLTRLLLGYQLIWVRRPCIVCFALGKDID